MKNRFFLVSILVMLAMVSFAGIAFSQQVMPTSQPNPGLKDCKNLYWFDSTSKACGLKSFCGDYMYQGLQTFKTKEECQKALDETITPEPTPVATVPSEPECNTLYWFDSTSKACGLKSFCGDYMYQGLQTFKTKEECQKALDESLGGNEEGENHVVNINNVTVSSGSSGGSTAGIGTVYSVGVCPSTIPEVCTEVKKPVCATISHFSVNGGYKKYRKTFPNWCEACRASTRTDLVIGYTNGACEQDSECPLVLKPGPEFCTNGKIKPTYKETANGKKCITSYICIEETPISPGEELPVFIYSESNASARTIKTFRLYKSGAMYEIVTQHAGSVTGVEMAKKLKGKISYEEAIEFLKKLDNLGFFEIEYLKDCRTTNPKPQYDNNAPSASGAVECPMGAANHTIYARYNKENKLHWYDGLTSEPESISYALERVKEFEKLMEGNIINSNIIVNLGEAFNLQIGQKATVRETGLKIRLERIEGETATLSVQPLFKPLLEKMTSVNDKGNGNTTVGSTGEVSLISRWVKLKVGEKKEVYGHVINLNSLMTPKCSEETLASGNTATKCIGAKPIANLTIKKAEEPNGIKAWLGKKFELMQGQTARLLDSQGNPALTMNLMRINTPSGCNPEPCKIDKNTGIKVCPMIWCDKRPVAKILWTLAFKSGETKPMIEMKPRILAIRKGETKVSGNFSFYFADIINNKAVFVVKKTEQDIQFQKVSLGEEFKLREKETALIEEKDIFVTLVRAVSNSEISKMPGSENPYSKAYRQKEYAIVSVWKKGWGAGPIGPVPLTKTAKERALKITANIKKIKAEAVAGSAGVNSDVIQEQKNIKKPTIPAGIMPYRKTYVLNPGQTLKIYDIRLTLKALDEKSAKLVANALGQGNTINAQVGEPFKLQEDMSARVIGANMRIDLLGIGSSSICAETYPQQCTDTKTVKIGVSKLLFKKIKKIGEPVENSTVAEEVKEHLVETATAQEGVSAQIHPIEMPPMPFRVFKLKEGESASVGDFEIKVNAIWEDTAELIVKEKATGQQFKYTIGKGWNLFSLPGQIRTIGTSNCHNSNFRLFKYVPDKKQFKKVIKPLPGEAYWLYNPGEPCSASSELVKPVSVFELEELQKGWNFVPVVKEMVGKSINEISNCKFKGAFFYGSGKWIKALGTKISEQDLGKALAVFAEEKCSLVNSNTPIPEIPELPEVE